MGVVLRRAATLELTSWFHNTGILTRVLLKRWMQNISMYEIVRNSTCNSRATVACAFHTLPDAI